MYLLFHEKIRTSGSGLQFNPVRANSFTRLQFWGEIMRDFSKVPLRIAGVSLTPAVPSLFLCLLLLTWLMRIPVTIAS